MRLVSHRFFELRALDVGFFSKGANDDGIAS